MNMKKIKFLFAVSFMIAALVSCNLQENTNILSAGNDLSILAVAIDHESTPVSDAGIIPVVLSGTANRGGNVTCGEVASAFGTTFADCGDRISYVCDDMGNCGFPGLPAEITVTQNAENRNLIDFSISGCIDGSYMVGAVIVKGATAANVYYYPEGTMGDIGLGAPGGLNMVSNLTFCFVECEEVKEVVTAVKLFYYPAGNMDMGGLALSSGDYIFSGVYSWCNYLGVNVYPNTSVFSMLDGDSRANVGTVTIVPGINSLIVTVDLNDGLLLAKTWVYAGNLEGLTGGAEPPVVCPAYTTWPFQSDLDANSVSFIVPY